MKKQITFLIFLSFITTRILASVTVPIASGASATDIQNAITAAKATSTDIILQFAKGGIWGSSTYGQDMTIAVPTGVTKLTLTCASGTGATPVLYLNTLTYADALMTDGITIDGLKVITTTANRYLIYSQSNTNFPGTVIVQNSWIEGYRAVFYLGANTNTVSGVTMTNNTFKTIGVSGIISTGAANNTLNNISITNNTFIDCNAVASAYFIDHRSNNPESTTLNFSNNTVYYSKGQLGNGFIRLTSSPTTTGHYTFNNNLFVAGVSGTTFKFGYGAYTYLTGTGNYASSKLGTAGSTSSVTFNSFTDNTPSVIFKNPYTFDFTINDQNFIAKTSAGNPALYAPTLTLPIYNVTSSIKTSVGDVNSAAGFVFPSSTKVSSGSDVTLTATPSYGYTFKEWDDANGNLLSTSNPYTISSVSADKSVVAVFTPNIITAWDFNPTSTSAQNRPGDYYYNSNNKGVMRLFETDLTTNIAWVNTSMQSYSTSEVAIKTAARRNTSKTDIQASKCRFFQAEVSTLGFKNIQIKSKIAYDNNSVFKGQKLQYSTDGTTYTDLTTISDISASPSHVFYWLDLNGSLPSTCDNKSTVYFRWVNANTTQVAASGSETVEDFYLTDVVVSGTFMSDVASSGDYIASTSGDVNTASNWIQWGGTSGTTVTAASAPTSTTNVWIPNGITMSNSSATTVKDLNVMGAYTANAGLTISGNLNLLSSTSGTGTILDNGNVSVTGTTNASQYLTNARNYYVSSPVNTSGLPASGFTLYNYNETTNNWDTPASFAKGVGYIALPGAAASTITFSGTLNTGNVNIDLTNSGSTGYKGFNLIGNPYPCHLAWTYDFVNANSSLIESSIWVRTNAGTANNSGQWSYITFNASSSEAVPLVANAGIIAPMQGFWVKAKQAGTLTLDGNLTKSHQTSNPLKAPSFTTSERKKLRLQVTNGVGTDETLIYFDGAATDGYDAYDSPKMSNNNNGIPEIYTIVDGQKTTMNGMNALPLNAALPLGFATGQAGSFKFKASQLVNFDTDVQVWLTDKITGHDQLLEEGAEYSFNSDVVSGSDRFSIVFRSPNASTNITDANAGNTKVYSNNFRQIIVSTVDSPDCGVEVYNVAGSRVYSQQISVQSSTLNRTFDAGVYLVKVGSDKNASVHRVVIK